MDFSKQVDALTSKVRSLTLSQILSMNPTFAEMRSFEWVRDIGYGHYPHHGESSEMRVVYDVLERAGEKI